MALADLLKDARLKPASPDADLRQLTPDFILRRARRLVELNPGDADPARPGDITSAATRFTADLIARDLPKVHAASEEIWRRVSTDPAHLPLDPAILRKRGTKRPPLSSNAARANRRRLVRSIVYQAAAFDNRLADPGSIERLHRLCDRRLRIAERMVYDVGQVVGRSWSRPQITAHRGGPWLDGWERMFEYPRLPESVFIQACQPDIFSVCSPPINNWTHPRIGTRSPGIPHRPHPRPATSRWWGRSLSFLRRPDPPPLPSSSDTLAYRMRTDVPEHWLPLLPQRLQPGDPSMTLRLGALPRVRSDGIITPTRPLGRLLAGATPGAEVVLREEEVPREGARVTVAYQIARWIDGRTFLWLGRRKTIGRGEASSSLRFDVAEEK